MQAATGHINIPLLGPFAVHDVFPFNAEPIIVHDLVLRKHNVFVGLDVIDRLFAEIRAGEDSDLEVVPHMEMIEWRALCRIDRGAGDPLPLSLHGTRLVEGFARSQRMESGASIKIIVEGVAGHFRWDYNATPPSIVLYSTLPNGNYLKFRVRSLGTQTLHHSTRYLQMLSTIKWLRANKSNTIGTNKPDAVKTSLDSIVDRYKREFPCERKYQVQDDKHKAQVHRSHIRTALVTPISIRSSRKVIKGEGLISREALKMLSRTLKDLEELGHVREAQPTRYLQPLAVPRPGIETDVPEGQPSTTDQIDEILNMLPTEFFLYNKLPTPQQDWTWTCPYEGCGDRIESKPRDDGQDAADTAIMKLRQVISRHFWEEHISKHLSQNSLGKLASHLVHVDSVIM